jgi:restriction endonuclease S subunit
MNGKVRGAVTDLMKREQPKLVAATGIFFDTLAKRFPQQTVESVLESHRSGVWGEEAAVGCGYPVLRSTNMRTSRADSSEAAWREIPSNHAVGCALQTGDILVTKSSGSSDLVGKSVLFAHPEDGRTYLFSNFIHRLRPNRNQVIPSYLAWFLRSPQALGWRYETQQNAVGLRNLQTAEFLSQKIPVPPLPIQQAIAQYFDGLEDRKDADDLPKEFAEERRIVARIEELAAKINEARELREQVAETEVPALLRATASRIFDSKWQHVRLEELCSLITDGTHQTPRYVDDGFTFLSAKNVKPFRFMPEIHRKVSAKDYHSCVARAKPQKGDVLMTRVGAMIGEAAVIDRDIDFAFYVSLAILRPLTSKILPDFLVHWLNSPGGLAQSRRQTLGKGHSQGNLNLKLLRGFGIPLPSISEQCRIVAELDKFRAQLDGVKRLQAETAAEFDVLLPSILDKAFKGEL